MSRQYFETIPGTKCPSDWEASLGFQRDDLVQESNGVREPNDPNYIFAHKPFYVCPECQHSCGNDDTSPERLGQHILTHEPEYDPLDMFNPKQCPKCAKFLEGGNNRLGISGEDYEFHVRLCNGKAIAGPAIRSGVN